MPDLGRAGRFFSADDYTTRPPAHTSPSKTPIGGAIFPRPKNKARQGWQKNGPCLHPGFILSAMHPNPARCHPVRFGYFVFWSLLLALLAALAVPAASAQTAGPTASSGASSDSDAARPSGLPLPRFVSLRSGEVNLRTGPGVQYPVDWVFRKRGLPLQVIAEYQAWRKLRDPEGAVGWVHQSMLSNRRSLIITGATGAVHAKAEGTSRVIARAEAGVMGSLLDCPDGMAWCRVEIGGYEGWMARTAFWGVLAGETVKKK